ncbi:unnamed protein product, partial [Symbiodinium necroappetens]
APTKQSQAAVSQVQWLSSGFSSASIASREHDAQACPEIDWERYQDWQWGYSKGLWHSDQPATGEVTAEQQAQRRANLIRTLSRRITGNVKAKTELKDALNQWFIQLSQHLQGLTARVSAIGQKIDEDLQSACDDMLAGLEARSSLSTADQVSHVRSSLGPVWQPPQETAILELAADSLDRSYLDMRALYVATAARDRSCGDTATYPLEATEWRTYASSVEKPTQRTAAPWPSMSTGFTPENIRPVASTEMTTDSPITPAGDRQPSLDWPAAWAKLAEFAAENGADIIGELCVSPEQDAAIPLVHNVDVEEDTVSTSNEAWAAVLAFVGTPDPAMVPAMCGRMQDVLNRLRLCPTALPRVRQGLVLLAQATLGNVLDPFSFAPATCQEWLYPAALLEHGTPLRGYLASSASSSSVVQVLLSQGCPMAQIGEDDADISELL